MNSKFRFKEYIEYQDGDDYEAAKNYAQQFQGDVNADICLIHSEISLHAYMLILPDTKQKLIDAYENYLQDSSQYNADVVHILATELDGIGCRDEAITVLEKNKESCVDSKAHLEAIYIEKWKDTGSIDCLKKAADCLYKSETCYLYADAIADTDDLEGKRYRIRFASKCVIKISYDEYCRRKNNRAHRDIQNDVNNAHKDLKKDVGKVIIQNDQIKIMLNAFSDKFDSLEDKVMNKLEAGFEEVNNITKSMQALSAEQQANASLVFDYLFEWRNAMEQNEEASAVRAKEIADKIIDLTNSVEKAETKIQEQFDTITEKLVKNTFSSHDDPKLDDMVKSADIMINNRFGNQLDEEAKMSLVSAIFTLAFYKKLSKNSISHTDFSGVAILATSALEIELNKRIYTPYLSFLKVKFYNNSQFIDANKLTRIPAETTYKDKDDNYRHKFNSKLNLGSFPFITGCRGDEVNNRALNRQGCRNLFEEFLSSDKITGALKKEYANYLFDSNQNYGRMEDFSDRLDKVRVIRNKAAHSETVSESQAEKVCVETFGTKGLTIAEQTNQDVLSLLDILVNSVEPFNPKQVQNHGQ